MTVRAAGAGSAVAGAAPSAGAGVSLAAWAMVVASATTIAAAKHRARLEIVRIDRILKLIPQSLLDDPYPLGSTLTIG